MKLTRKVDIGEYIVIIEHDDNGSGYIKVTVLDELEEELEFIEITNDNEDINPSLN